jgi:heat shock protein HslJ
VIVAGCASAPAPSATSATIGGHTYLSTEIQGATLAAGTQVRLTFTDGEVNASAGCNMMGGSYAVVDGRLKTSQMFMTEMACDEVRMHQDEWFARFIADVAFTLDGDTLILSDGTVRLTLLDKEVATPDQPLEGTLWRLDGIVSGDAVSSVPAGVTASIRITSDRVDVKPGCNSGGGAADVTADTITFGPIALTKMACEPTAMSVENAVAAVLAGTATYTIDADVLTLKNGSTGLVFRAAH